MMFYCLLSTFTTLAPTLMLKLFSTVLIVLLKLYDDYNGWGVYLDGQYRVAKRNGAKVDCLTMFDDNFIKDYVCFLGTSLHIFYRYPKVRMMSLGSYRCELFFAYLRNMSHFDNTLNNARTIIGRYFIIRYIEATSQYKLTTARINSDKMSIFECRKIHFM